MDVSSSGGALLVSILRLLHIVGGLIWVGAALVMSFYIEPALKQAGAAGSGILHKLYRQTNYARLIPLSALVTTVAGLLLYGALSYHETLSSSMGVILSLGAFVGLLAFLHGWFAVWRPAGQYAEMSESRTDEISALEAKMRRNGRISMWLALSSLVLMAGARYIGPVLG